MNSPQQTSHSNDDEISLVDLAKILVRRRWWLAGIFSVVFALALLFAWIKQPVITDKVAYTTLFAVGYKTPTALIEPLPSIVTLLEDAFIPAARQQLSKAGAVDVSFVEQSNIVKLITEREKGNQEEVAELHMTVLQPLLDRHEALLSQLEQSQSLGTIFGGAEIQQAINSDVASLAQPSSAQTTSGTSPALIIVLGIVLASMLAVMGGFFMEFIAQVRKSIADSDD